MKTSRLIRISLKVLCWGEESVTLEKLRVPQVWCFSEQGRPRSSERALCAGQLTGLIGNSGIGQMFRNKSGKLSVPLTNQCVALW